MFVTERRLRLIGTAIRDDQRYFMVSGRGPRCSPRSPDRRSARREKHNGLSRNFEVQYGALNSTEDSQSLKKPLESWTGSELQVQRMCPLRTVTLRERAMSDSDRQLMLLVQAGDRARFSELVDRFRARLVRFAASSLHDRQAAEDLAQETFRAVYQARHTYNPQFAVSTWIWTILLNLVKRERERRARRTQLETRAGERQPAAWAPQLEEREQLDAWLSQIPDAEADALRLRFFGELSFDEIAQSMKAASVVRSCECETDCRGCRNWLATRRGILNRENGHEL